MTRLPLGPRLVKLGQRAGNGTRNREGKEGVHDRKEKRK